MFINHGPAEIVRNKSQVLSLVLTWALAEGRSRWTWREAISAKVWRRESQISARNGTLEKSRGVLGHCGDMGVNSWHQWKHHREGGIAPESAIVVLNKTIGVLFNRKKWQGHG